MAASKVLKFEAVLIGTGQAIPSLAGALNAKGIKTAVIERSRYGGSCVNYGCIPTKALVASARRVHVARNSAAWGVVLPPGEVKVDMKVIKERKDMISGRSNSNVESWIKGMEHVSAFDGHASFTDANTVEVSLSDGSGKVSIAGEKLYLNVGCRARVPEIEGINDVPYLINSSILQLDTLPEHLIVIGGSYIGLEFAQIYRRFGSKVTVIHRHERVIPRDDPDVSECIQTFLGEEGVEFELNASPESVKKTENGVIVTISTKDGEKEIAGSHIFLAVGRVPNTQDLGLDKAGIEQDTRGFIKVNDVLQTNVPHIYALGDVNGKGAFTHTSYNDFEIVAANLLEGDDRKVSDRITCYGLFTDPPLGRCGMTEAQARASGRKLLKGYRPFTRVGRAFEKGETTGFMKVLVDADTKEVLGAAILGVSGDEAVQVLLAQMYSKQPYTTLSRSVPIHPTVSELIPTILQGLEPFE